jgi:hypothetical protein
VRAVRPEFKGGSEATARIAKPDLVPTEANLLTGYDSFADLAAACEVFCEEVNGRLHRETGVESMDVVYEIVDGRVVRT